MEPTVIMWTGENLGAFSVNTDQVMGNTLNVFTDFFSKFFSNPDNVKNTIIVVVVLVIFALIKMWTRRKDDARRHEDREAKERERANIWKEEYKNK